MNARYFKLFVSTLVLTPLLFMLLINIFNLSEGWTYSLSFAYVILSILTAVMAFNTQELNDETFPPVLNKFRLWMITAIVSLFLINTSTKVGTFHNESLSIKRQYEQKCQSREGFYDKLWKTYTQKENILNLNKETFVEVSKMIMENRKDGANLTWKWTQEVSQIPFSEFTKFYSDLSTFIESQREAYYALEVECQVLAAKYNLYVDVFPNNAYNLVLNKKHIDYKYGFTSDSTKKVFKTGMENLK